MGFNLQGGLLAAVFGLIAHIYFKKYEPTDLFSLSLLLGVVPAVPAALLRTALNSTPLAVIAAYTIYYSNLLLSIVIYRTSRLHPLSKYPGPIICKLSKFWLVYVTSRGKLHLYYRQLHETYGPIVRIGPNELSIVDTTLLPSILGADGMPKGPLWEGRRIQGKRAQGKGSGKGNLIGSRDKKNHAEARRVWNRAFTTASVKRYEPIVLRRAAQMVEELKKRIHAAQSRGDEPDAIDLSEWLSFFSFDFMGDFVFGGPFDLLRDGDKDGFLRTMTDGLYLPALTQHVPWCMDALVYTPFAGKGMKGLGEFAFKQVTRRMKEGSVHDDLFYHLNDEGSRTEPPPLPLLMSNAVTAIVAGSDTTASVMSNIFYYIVTNASCYARLQAELDAAFPPGKGEPTDSTKLSQLEYMNAVINETLRLRPPASTSLQRAPSAGSGGHMIGSSMFIPEGTAVYSSPYVYQRDPRYFSPYPEKFWPERWLAGNDADIILNLNAFIPFSTGPANCVGKPVAILEMRLVLASMLHHFEMRLAKDYRAEQWEHDLEDHFVLQKGPLPVILTARLPN